MQRSELIGELIAGLAKAQLKFTAATKDSKNPYYGSNYADLASVIGAVRPALNEQGIALMQTIDSDLERQTASSTTSLHKGEQWISFTVEAPAVGKAKDGKDRFDVQTLGAVHTYLRRYGVQAICGLASEDDDGNSVVRDDAKPVPAKRITPAKAEDSAVTGVRSQFFSKAKECGWGLGDIKKFILKSFPEAGGSTASLSEEQLNDSLKIMAEYKPADIFAEPVEAA